MNAQPKVSETPRTRKPRSVAEYQLWNAQDHIADLKRELASKVERVKCADALVQSLTLAGEQKDATIATLRAALEEIREIVDGEVDINNNGGPNTAMKVLTEAQKALA